MTRTLHTKSDIDELSQTWVPAAPPEPIVVPSALTVADIMASTAPAPGMLIEGMIPLHGACLIVGAPKSGKTLLAAQAAIAIASGTPLLGRYKILHQGPVLMVEQDDPAATASVRDILQRSAVPTTGIPFFLHPKSPFSFGPEFIAWLESEIAAKSLRFVVLDSYTALRRPRAKGGDIVKAEEEDLRQLDELAKRTNCAIAIIHHGSKGSAGLHWSQQAAGTYAMSASTEGQIVIARFHEIDGPERLVRMRVRHGDDLEMVLRFRRETLDYEHVLEGGAASSYPLIRQISAEFGPRTFGPRELVDATGVSRATAHRHISRLYDAGVLTKRGFGEYVLDVGVKQ